MRRIGKLLRKAWWRVHLQWLHVIGRVVGDPIYALRVLGQESSPRNKLFNLTILGAVRSVTGDLPCDVTISSDNFAEYLAEFDKEGDPDSARARQNPDEAWRLIRQRADEIPLPVEIHAKGTDQVGLVDVQVTRGENQQIRARVSRMDPAKAEEWRKEEAKLNARYTPRWAKRHKPPSVT